MRARRAWKKSSFSRRAAHELTQRAGRMLHAALPWAGTFHGVGARLLREHAAAVGLAPQFSILDRADAEDLMGIVRQAQGLAATARRFPLKGGCLAVYSRVVNSQVTVAQALQQHFPWWLEQQEALRRLFAAYVDEKQRQQLLDYDDLLLYWHHLMAEPALARRLAERFDHVLVDEYQDTNRLQAAILRALKPDGRGLIVVGDDAQAIYSFRAAEPRNILEFAQAFAPPARVVTLTRNYRATQPLLDLSNAVMTQAARRIAKELRSQRAGGERPQLVAVLDEAAQARWVADAVLARREGGLALRESRWPDDVATAARWLQPQHERLYDDAALRAADLAQLARLASGFADRERFLAELTLDPPEATSAEAGAPHRDEDYLILSTMHSAKGQEWSAVYLLNVVDGCIPSDMATGDAEQIEEERRLLYVALTRARQHLALLVPQRFHVTQQSKFGDRHLYGGITRFVPAQVAALCDEVEPRPHTGPCDVAEAPAAPLAIDVMARVRAGF